MPSANQSAILLRRGHLGALVADAVAMPMHWYYDTHALDRDYGRLSDYVAPKNPHPDSILWRSRYVPLSPEADILHEQAQYWGQRGVHYHQFLRAGENTLNYKLAAELHRWVTERDGYDADAWLEHYIAIMRMPGWHRDTYVEEVHRGFFANWAKGKKPRRCAVADLHIGALSQVPALLSALSETGMNEPDRRIACAREHVSLTHDHRESDQATLALARILEAIAEGEAFEDALFTHGNDYASRARFETWAARPDREVVGRILSPACYLPESMTAALYLAWRYQLDFSSGVIANARVGGDNCHRSAVVGSLLGASLGVPERWVTGLQD